MIEFELRTVKLSLESLKSKLHLIFENVWSQNFSNSQWNNRGFWKIWKVPYTFYIVDDDAKENPRESRANLLIFVILNFFDDWIPISL